MAWPRPLVGQVRVRGQLDAPPPGERLAAQPGAERVSSPVVRAQRDAAPGVARPGAPVPVSQGPPAR
ncbi:MAG: hypothetical protein ABJI82_08310, partial [Alphaproteobacteria bacterium]